MKSTSTYTELLHIDIMHNYYNDGTCPDFSIVPTPECSNILEGHRIIVKNKINGIQLVLPVNKDKTPFIDLSGISKLTFYMMLNEMAFSNYTNLSPVIDNKIYCYTNKEDPDEVETGELIPTRVKRSGLDLPVNDVSVFGVIDIYYSPLSADLNAPSAYTISFTAKEITWSYYFITNPNPDKTPSVYSDHISFGEDQGVTDSIGEELQEKYPHSNIHLFQSVDKVSYQERGRRNIEFRVEDIGNLGYPETIIENLPNPSIYDNGIKILKSII